MHFPLDYPSAPYFYLLHPLLIPKTRPRSKSASKCFPLQETLPLLIIRPLILHPIPKLAHTPNLLPIVIRYRVRKRLARWIDTVALDSSVEIFLLLFQH